MELKTFRIPKELIEKINKNILFGSFSSKLRKAINSGLSKKPIDNSNYDDIRKELKDHKNQIAAIGRNLNQLVLMMNMGHVLKPDELDPNLLDIKIKLKEAIKLYKEIQLDIKIK